MENHNLYKINDRWEWYDGVFMGIATVPQDRVSKYCLEQADDMRNSILGNYDDLTTEQRERLAKLWEAAINLPDGKYDYYFNLDNKKEVFIQSIKKLGEKLGIDYDLFIKDYEN